MELAKIKEPKSTEFFGVCNRIVWEQNCDCVSEQCIFLLGGRMLESNLISYIILSFVITFIQAIYHVSILVDAHNSVSPDHSYLGRNSIAMVIILLISTLLRIIQNCSNIHQAASGKSIVAKISLVRTCDSCLWIFGEILREL